MATVARARGRLRENRSDKPVCGWTVGQFGILPAEPSLTRRSNESFAIRMAQRKYSEFETFVIYLHFRCVATN